MSNSSEISNSTKILIYVLIPIIIIVMVVLLSSSWGKTTNENYNNNPNEYKTMPYRSYDGQDELTTCQRCNNFNASSTVYNGYQTAPEPPAPYWPYRNQPDIPSTKSHFQNYTKMSSPLDDMKFEQCHDAYRCNRYGVATGVQGHIF